MKKMELSSQIMSDIAVHMKYARHLAKKERRENYKEIVTRNKKMHLDKFPELKDEIEEAYKYVYTKEVLPSMRSFQFAGKPVEINAVRSYNCCYHPIDHMDAFAETMFLLLSGTGVGYSVQKHHVEKLPKIIRPTETQRFLVGDSIEGWSDAVKVLMKAYFTGGPSPLFDFNDIRAKGTLLVTSGGKAPGPEPLKDGLHNIQKILDRKHTGERLSTLDVHDIICFIADVVLSGGIRRAALICLFSLDDDNMLTCKFGDWYVSNPQRGRANNSAVILRHEIEEDVFLDLWKKIELSGSGEPGLFFTNDAEWGLNPCFTGDTMVAVADGRGYVSFAELAKEAKDVPVFSLDADGIIRTAWMRRPRVTAQRAKIFRICLDDGNVIRVTENHKFPLTTGEIKTTSELCAGDSLKTLVKFKTQLWDNKNSQKYTFIRSGRSVRAEHRVIAEHAYNIDLLNNSDIATVHHKDFDACNNKIDNLEVMSVQKHTDIHRQHMIGENNPIHAILASPARRAEFLKKLSVASSGKSNPNCSGYSDSELREHAIILTKQLGRRASHKDWIRYAKKYKLPQQFSKWRKTHLGGIIGFLKNAAIECGMEDISSFNPRTTKRFREYVSQGYDCFINDCGILMFNKICELSGEPFVTEIPEHSINPRYRTVYMSNTLKNVWKNNRNYILGKLQEGHNKRKVDMREQQAAIYNDLQFTLHREPLKQEWKSECLKRGISFEISRKSSPFRSYDILKEYAATSNHKVVSVVFDGYEDVYNGTVDDWHNFFVGKFEIDDKIVSINTLNCGEISLKANQFCNLTTINVGNIETQEELNARAKAAAFISTLQAAYTNFHYLRPIWKKVTEKEALIGVSPCGIASGKFLQLDMKEAANIVKEENTRVAELIGIKSAARCTTVKPDGTVSLVLGTSSGIHAWHSKYYIRRIRVGKNEAIYTYLKINHPELVEDEYFKPHLQAVISVPIKAPEGAITREESALDLLERVSKVWKEWVKIGHRRGANKNNVSTTVTVKPHEWKEVGDWMWKHRDHFTALSVLPHDGGSYIQTPFEECTEEQYNEMMKNLTKINLDDVVEIHDDTKLQDQAACASGACEIV